MTNRDIAHILEEISLLLAMDNVPFKPRAYAEVARLIGGLDRELEDIYHDGGRLALEELPGIGAGLAEKIEILLTTDRLPYYEQLKKKYPIDASALSSIEGIGPHLLKKLYRTLGVKTVADLERAIDEKKLERVRGLGVKTAAKLKHSLHFMRLSGARFLLAEMLPGIEKIAASLRKVPGVTFLEVAGSVRRMKETIGDVDLVAASKKPELLMDSFVNLPDVAEVVARGATKSMIRLKNGLDLDLRVVPKDSIGAAFIYFTGSREHQLVLRREAIKNGWTLNEYGLFTNHAKEKSKRKFLAGKTEAEVYRALGLSFIPPELREVTGELEVAAKHRLPALVGFNDLLGDLQVQTDWTDGDSSIEQMALAARHNGLEYIAITDHTKGLAMVGGSNEARIRKQMKEIDRLNKKFRGKPLILKGAEVNILKNGELDIADEVLAELDVVGAAVHANFHQTQAEMTKRICKAISNRHVDILFHPTGRLINRRAPYEVDIDEVIRVAKKTGTVLEINGAPDRLDLKDVYIKTALASGIKFAIDSDAHDPSHFSFLRYGLGQARRGWARKSDIINTYPVKVMLSFLKDGKNKFSDKK